MDFKTKCPNCSQKSPILETHCPHCNTQFSGTPNVRIAKTTEQQDALETRYNNALQLARANGVANDLANFESDVQSSSHAVLTLSYAELRYLVENERRVFATFYQRVEEGLQIPSGGKWDVLRGISEHALYQHQKTHIRFAALSLNNVGVKNYGDCHVTMKESMIADRTSTFEDNNVVFNVYTSQASMEDAISLPAGYLSDWDSRHKLAVAKAKYTEKIANNRSNPVNPEDILIDQGTTTTDDRFVELHIWGSMTVLTIEKVIVIPRHVKRKKRPKKAEIASLREILKEEYNIEVIEP